MCVNYSAFTVVPAATQVEAFDCGELHFTYSHLHGCTKDPRRNDIPWGVSFGCGVQDEPRVSLARSSNNLATSLCVTEMCRCDHNG